MKDRIGRFLIDHLSYELIYILGIVWVGFLVYLDRDDYKNWDKLPLQDKVFDIVKVIALVVMIVGALVEIF